MHFFEVRNVGRVQYAERILNEIANTVEPGFSKLFERRKNVYYCQVFTIYHGIYAVIAYFGKQQKVY